MGELAQTLAWRWDEGTLVTGLKEGSEDAFDHLVTHYHSAVYGLVFGIVGRAPDAADVTQEVFLKVFRGIRGFRGGSSLKTWLYRIAVREALNHQRWRWRHHREQFSLEDDTHPPSLASMLEDNEPSPYEATATHEQQKMVRDALLQVAAPFRSAVILRDLEGLSYEEIAEVLDVSVGTVKSRILRGRRALREVLEPILNSGQATTADERVRTQSIHRTSDAALAFSPAGNLRPARAAGGRW